MSGYILWDLVPTSSSPPGPSFSPFCMRARLALLRKGIDFETRFVTYHDLRFGGWKEKLGVDLATAPILERPDGTYLMDSTQIALWLDETYPSKPNLFLPAAATPVDLESSEYKEAVENFDNKLKDIASPGHESEKGIRARGEYWCAIFWLYARRIVRLFDKETAEYWVQDSRLGDGTWKSVVTRDQEPLVESVQTGCRNLSSHLSKNNAQFFSSPNEPGMTDFSLFGSVQLIRSVSPKLFQECFLAPGDEFAGWVKKMDELFPMEDVRARDCKEEVEVCKE
ncbi:uncharacterized protein JCM6883_002436 [Sporobolomyces salmoneus]|uniref:uncharacterized protein n=1 Tax=Sporobolomyces salmoneus TaxID=183962 RepID=UPI003180AF57